MIEISHSLGELTSAYSKIYSDQIELLKNQNNLQPTGELTGEPMITQYHLHGGCCVDYILYTSNSNIQINGIVEVLDLNRIHQAKYGTKNRTTDSLPNKFWGSDHFSLITDISFV